MMSTLRTFTSRQNRSVDSSSTQSKDAKPMSSKDQSACLELLQEAEMFRKVPPSNLRKVVKQMTSRHLKKGDVLHQQNEITDRFYLLHQGDIKRSYIDPNTGKHHNVEFLIKAKSINSMRIISGEPAFGTAKCASQDGCHVYQMMRDDFLRTLEENPVISTGIAEGLCEQLRRGSKTFQTPLLEQQQLQEVNLPAVSIAAGIESYYRSALNAMLNQRLTGVKAEWFPNMHIQVPVRVAYIAGFKGLRAFLDKTVEPESSNSPNLVRLGAAITPGIIMTPISSLLEASNAGHMNKESMTTRWMRGAVPRAGREIIFGVGLNQMSDFCEERVAPFCKGNDVLANAVGSILAGVVSGYLSHVPHNISTLKLLEPHVPYPKLYQTFVDKSVPPVIETMVESWPATTRSITRTVFATLFPRGVMIRTTQIVGSFMILNGTINYLQLREHQKIQRAVRGNGDLPG